MADAGQVSVLRTPWRLVALPVVLACAALVLPAGASAAAPCRDAGLMPSSANLTGVRAATLCLINAERSRRGLKRLTSSSKLREVALRYSLLMVRERFFSHVSPSGSTLISRVRSQTTYLRGARSSALGENISWGSGVHGTPLSTVTAWMSSPAHRAEILTRGFRSIGIGIAGGAPLATAGSPAATYTTVFGRRS